MQHLEVSCAVRRFFKSLGFKGLMPRLRMEGVTPLLPHTPSRCVQGQSYFNTFGRMLKGPIHPKKPHIRYVKLCSLTV